MFTKTPALVLLLTIQQYGAAAAPTWPASSDELEDILYLNTGYRSRGFAAPVTPCSKGVTAGRITAAEWVRTAFHDAISGNVFTKTGGLDGSIAFELATTENAGNAFPSSVGMWAPFFSTQTSFADVVAAGIYAATRACGGPVVPIKYGRRDATGAGPVGFVPQPQNGIGTFRNQFGRLGLNDAGMIQLVACGHTLGGVHASENPLILDAGTAPNDFATMDTSPSTFDGKIASEFVTWNTKNPLVVGKSTTNGRNSDSIVFQADNNVTIRAMQTPTTFSNVCQAAFQQMIEVVPSGVTLTDPVTPYEVKPYAVQLTLLGGGSKIRFTGDIRVRTTQRGNIAQVQLVYKDRTGAAGSSPIDTTVTGQASGFDDTFAFFGFSADLDASTSISSFNVLITLSGGTTQTFDNNGNGFPVDDNVIFQAPQSCLDGTGKLSVVAAVRNGATPNLQVVVKNPRPSPNPVPILSTATAPMATQSAVGSYQLYSADYTFSGSQASSAVFGVSAGSSSDRLKNTNNLPTACAPLSTSTPTSNPSTSTYTFRGCYYDAGAPRALAGSGTTAGDMSVDKCATFCSSFKFFGTEYGQECYCGNTLDASSTIRALSDCNMPCAGNNTQTCGAGNRISLYQNSKFSPPVNPQIPGYDYKGCYSEGTAGRALGDSATASDTMTVDSCAAFCNGANYFGVEYGRECYCGATLGTGSVVQPATDCNMLCAGNTTEYCGAGNRLNIYQLASSSPSPSPTPTPTPTPSPSPSPSASASSPIVSSSDASTPSPTPTPTPTPSPSPSPTPSSSAPSFPGYDYIGCLKDDPGNRALVGKSQATSSNSYTTCASFCSDYQYFGVEYSAECFCANSLTYTELHPDADCNMACSGASTLSCGGPSRITVFKSTSAVQTPQNPDVAGYAYKGCYTDSVGARTLNGAFFFDAQMTVEKCKANCAGAALFGVEYGGECYCGEAFANPTTKSADSECSMVCGGNSLEFCGAGNRLTVYEKTA